MSHSKAVSVLLVEDEPTDAQRIQICLRQFKEIPLEVMRIESPGAEPKKTIDSRLRDMHFDVTWVRSLALALQKIAEFHFDVLILNLSLPDSQGLATLRAIKQAADSLPIIVLIDQEDIDAAQTTLNIGAKSYIVKDDSGYEDLIRVMRYVLHRSDVETRNLLLVAALEATSNAIMITDRDVRIEWTNPAFTELTGYSFQEALGRQIGDLLKSGVHEQAFYTQMWQKLMNGEHWQGEIVNKHKDGSFYNADVGISPVLNKDGSLSGYVQIQRDITDSVVRLAISEVLQQAIPLDERFKQVLEVFFKLKDFELQRKGGVFLRAKGENHLTLLVLSGAFSAEFIERESCINCGSCLCGRVAVSGKLLVSDDCFCDPRHEHKYPDMQAHGHYIVPIASGGDVLGVLFLYTDPHPQQSGSRLTMLEQVGEMMALALRQEEAKTALETARDMAMQASLIKSEFLANMSHEIRTPMNGVLGMLDLLRETKMTSAQRDWLETAHSSGEALLEIINDILDLSKLEAGKFEVEKVDFNLVDLVEDICALLARRAHTKGLELNCLFPMPMPFRWQGDPMRIRQVLTNLIGNAVKFTEQGEVSVSIIRPPATDEQQTLRFEVYDTGIGISAEAQARLFKPFSQADSATSRRFGGSGLGLSISKKLVELMGGAIGMNSTLGIGTCFWFTLPLEQSECREVMEDARDFSGKRILIVDDNTTNRNILINYLTRWGLDVSQVDNGSAALMQLQTSALQGVIYDLILLDMQMPVMDGLTLAKCLAQIPALAKIPIILLSSGDQLDLVDYQRTGIVQRLLKPVRQLQLFDAIVNTLQGASSASINKPAPPEIQLPSYSGKKVLVVEDNKINQKVIIAKLAKFDIVPDVAENGRVALDKLAQDSYDLILMDCHMPIMDGYMATRELRLLESSKGLHHQTVIALTANALEGEREKCLAAGMDGYLTKPIVSEQLKEVLAYRLGIPAEIAPTLSDENSSSTASSGIVWDETAALKHLDGDSDLLYEMIDLFLIEGPKQLKELLRFQAEGNLLALANTAHAIKGAIGHFYAETAKACSSKLEHAARSGQAADFQGMTEALVDAVTDLMTHLLLAKHSKNHVN